MDAPFKTGMNDRIRMYFQSIVLNYLNKYLSQGWAIDPFKNSFWKEMHTLLFEM